MLRRSILDRKLNESGIYMNPKLGRFINEAMEEYATEINSNFQNQIEVLKSRLNNSCNYNKSDCPFTEKVRNMCKMP